MKFNFIWIGKTRDKSYKALQEEYLRRLSHFVKCEITEIREAGAPDAKSEGKRIIDKVNHSSFVCLLDVTGNSLSSPQLAKKIEKWQNAGLRDIVFIIGGAGGTSQEVAERANFRLSLSFLTFTHEMARVVMLEQLYRAFSIIKGFPYQK
ncbi:23S rRNA (pseudouridine(1915)-N(3))-methyltransferase RlmH [soil metagenome]